MGLDIYLRRQLDLSEMNTGIIISVDGIKKELSLADIMEKFPNCTFVEFEKDDYISLFDDGITHNLAKMADKCGLYEALWRPYRLHPFYKNFATSIDREDYHKELDFERSIDMYARDIINHLEYGLAELKSNPQKYKEFNSPNGWGEYGDLVRLAEKYLKACKQHPHSLIIVSR